jgi:hypothetical protein
MAASRLSLPLTALLLLSAAARAELYVNAWHRVEHGDIPGQRWDVPLGCAPGEKGFLVLGGRTSWDEYHKGPRPYDQLAIDGLDGC